MLSVHDLLHQRVLHLRLHHRLLHHWLLHAHGLLHHHLAVLHHHHLAVRHHHLAVLHHHRLLLHHGLLNVNDLLAAHHRVDLLAEPLHGLGRDAAISGCCSTVRGPVALKMDLTRLSAFPLDREPFVNSVVGAQS